MVLFETEKYGFIESNFTSLRIILEFPLPIGSEYVWDPKKDIKIIQIIRNME